MPDNSSSKTTEATSLKDRVSEEEWKARVNLAACYRLAAHYGWDDLIYTHISLRIPGPEHHFLINPLGLMFDEITASSLIKIDLEGNKLDDSPYMVNKAGFIIHSAIHQHREDAACVIHLHSDYGVAVSNLAEGLLPLCQNAIVPWLEVAYHDYEGLAVRAGEQERLIADMGDKRALILRNHGTLTTGTSAAQAFELMFFLEKACKIQILSQSTGAKLHRPSDASIKNVEEDLTSVAGSNGSDLLVWPALLRKLDRIDTSYRT